MDSLPERSDGTYQPRGECAAFSTDCSLLTSSSASSRVEIVPAARSSAIRSSSRPISGPGGSPSSSPRRSGAAGACAGGGRPGAAGSRDRRAGAGDALAGGRGEEGRVATPEPLRLGVETEVELVLEPDGAQ